MDDPLGLIVMNGNIKKMHGIYRNDYDSFTGCQMTLFFSLSFPEMEVDFLFF